MSGMAQLLAKPGAFLGLAKHVGAPRMLSYAKCCCCSCLPLINASQTVKKAGLEAQKVSPGLSSRKCADSGGQNRSPLLVMRTCHLTATAGSSQAVQQAQSQITTLQNTSKQGLCSDTIVSVPITSDRSMLEAAVKSLTWAVWLSGHFTKARHVGIVHQCLAAVESLLLSPMLQH